MKKLVYAVVAFAFVVLLSSSFARACVKSVGTLDADVTVGNPKINRSASQQITATTNAGGVGVLFVIQPAIGTPWMTFLSSHFDLKALWYSLPIGLRTQIADEIDGKIISYKLVAIGHGGGSKIYSFPEDFTGINGLPSTALMGKYDVLFAFVSNEVSSFQRAHCQCFCLFHADFDCGSWFVVPEVPFGTVLPLLTSLLALPVLKLVRRKHP